MTSDASIGRYRIDGVLGRGGMGVVYAGWDPGLQRRVAIKVLSDARSADSHARLLREARAMARLSHPNVITVYEVGSDDGRDFIAMELVEGTNLAQWLSLARQPDEILRTFVDAGRGLAAAHAAGMIHRDFKPQNVLVRRDGRVLVTDFGLVRDTPAEVLARHSAPALAAPDPRALENAITAADTPADSVDAPRRRVPTRSELVVTETGALLGTPGYMAPEQFRGDASPRSDQFSFCVALWQALTGSPPFDGDTYESRLASIESGVTDARGAQLSAALRAVLARGLAATPSARWPSMAVLLAKLEPQRGRKRWIGALVAAALAGAGGVAAVSLITRSEPATSRSVAPAPADLFAGASVRHLTFDDGCEEYPAFTPDGKTVVFDRTAGGSPAIQAIDLDTDRVRTLTAAEAWSFKAAVSPDGRSVAFVRRDDTARATYIVPLAGGPARRVGIGGLRPIWDPAGRLWIGSGPTVQLVAPDTGDVLRTLTSPDQLRPEDGVVLPDGRLATLMFPTRGDLPATGIAVFAQDGTMSWLIENAFVGAIAVAPDHDAVLVSHLTESGARELWRIPLDGDAPSVVKGPAQPTYGLAISADGKRAVWSDCGPKTELILLSGDLKTSSPLPTGAWIEHSPAAIPGTQHIVIVSDRDAGYGLWVVDLARKEPARRLPVPKGEAGDPAVSLDGATVYDITSDGELTAQPLDGSAPPRILATHVAGAPAPRRDGSLIVAIEHGDAPALAVVPAGGGDPAQLVAEASSPAASPVSDDLYYVSHARSGDGIVMHRDGTGATRPLSAELPAGRWSALSVSADGKRVAVLSEPRLVVVDARTGHVLGHYEAEGASELSGVTWVESSLLVSRYTFQGDLWLLDRGGSASAGGRAPER